MHRTCQFVAATVIEAGIDRVYAFHENPHNIHEISPGWQRVQVIHAGQEARAGESFQIKIRFFDILPMDWQGVWREASRPSLLGDEMLSGPFASWHHEHRFESLGPARTKMTDRVEYQFFGGLIGKLFGETLGRLQFHLMFADRHARTRRRLREQS